ncbi:MAG: hypothetical protein JRI63_14000 [Deltaproteobacteria bacterium]|nr:hypothetical protein [Deltaproteobacteria bacterium]
MIFFVFLYNCDEKIHTMIVVWIEDFFGADDTDDTPVPSAGATGQAVFGFASTTRERGWLRQ